MALKRHDRSPERTKTDQSLREERANTDDAIKGDRDSSERDAESVIDRARALADAAVKAERKKTDKEALLPARPAKKGAVVGQRSKADRAVRGERASADDALRSDLQDRAEALEALLVHERAATDAYLLTERVRSDKDVSHRDDFLGMVAHDVRNLLNLVVLSLAMLRPDDEEPPPHVTAATTRIRRYVARMNRLIGDLVDVTSIDAGKLGVEAVEGDAATLLTEATETFQPAALEKGVSLSTEIPPGPLRATFDHDRCFRSSPTCFRTPSSSHLAKARSTFASNGLEACFGSVSATPGWESRRRCWSRSSSGSGRWGKATGGAWVSASTSRSA